MMTQAMCAFMTVKTAVLPTPAFDQYCTRNPVACMQTGSMSRVNMTEALWSKVQLINTYVNHSTVQRRDIDMYGVEDYWEIADGQGDCEDLALLKQKYLVDNGIPISDLLLTVVKDDAGNGHAVLTLRTSQGDYILDNKTNEIKLWSQTSYDFFARQSYRDYKLWLKIEKCKQ